MEEYVSGCVMLYVEWPDMGHPWLMCTTFLVVIFLGAKHLTFKGWKDNKITSALVVLTASLFIYMCKKKNLGRLLLTQKNPENLIAYVNGTCRSIWNIAEIMGSWWKGYTFTAPLGISS